MKSLLVALAPFVLGGLLFAQEPKFQFTHKGSVLHVKFSPSGSKLISYSSGNQDLALWEVSVGNLLWKRPISFIQKADEYYTLNAIAWSPDETLVATGSANGTVQLWNAIDGTFIWRKDVSKDSVSAIAFSPDAKIIAATGYGSDETAATLINTTNGATVKKLIGNKCRAIGIAFDPSGEELSIGNLDGNVVRWNLATQIPVNSADCTSRYAYGGERSFSQDLTLSVRRTTAEQIVLEDSDDGKVIKTFELNASSMRSVVNSRAQKAIIEEYGGYRVYDLSSGAERTLGDCVSGSAFDLSDDGRYFAQSCDGFKTSIRVTDLNSNRSWFLDGHPSTINAVAYSPDFSLLAVAGNDGNAYLFDPTTRSLKKLLTGTESRLTALAFSFDGKLLITGDENGVLHRWDLATDSLLSAVKVNDRSDDIDKIEASVDGKNVLALTNSTAFVLDKELQGRGSLQTPEEYSSTSGNMTLTFSSVPTETAAFSSDGKYIVTGHSDGTLRFWDVATSRQARKFKIADAVKFVAPVDHTHVLTVTSVRGKTRFQVINSADGRINRQSPKLDGSFLEKMFLSPNRRFAAVTDISGDVVICSLDTMMLRTLGNRLSGSDSVAFSRDAKTFFIGGDDQNLSLYDTLSLERHWTLLSEFTPSQAETRLTRENALRVAEIVKRKQKRDREAAAYAKTYRNKVYVTFEHYGDMSDPGEKRMIERNELNESKQKKSSAESNAVWLRLHNDSTLPIEVPTESMYFPDSKCFHQFPNGEKMSGLCKDREIGIWFGVKNRRNNWIPYGFDFGSSVVLLPNSSVLFPVPLSIWDKSYSIVFDYSFQNLRASENDRAMDFGDKIEMRVNKLSIRRSVGGKYLGQD